MLRSSITDIVYDALVHELCRVCVLCVCVHAGDGEGQGWTFAPAAIEPMVAAVSSAVHLYRDEPDKWQALQLRGMSRDVSWERAAQQYEQVLTEAMADAVQFSRK
jgi:glycogen synthase